MMGIEIQKLKESDKGRLVFYKAVGRVELGRITSWNNGGIFVRYFLLIYTGETETEFIRIFKMCGDTSAQTNARDLDFCEVEE